MIFMISCPVSWFRSEHAFLQLHATHKLRIELPKRYTIQRSRVCRDTLGNNGLVFIHGFIGCIDIMSLIGFLNIIDFPSLTGYICIS